MAIYCEFYNLVVPVSRIEDVYPGGLEQFKSEQKEWLGKTQWHDQYLYHQGAMDYDFITELIVKWEKLGLVSQVTENGQPQWKDVCVILGLEDGPVPPCEWIVYDYGKQIVYLKGTEPGEIAGPERKGFKGTT